MSSDSHAIVPRFAGMSTTIVVCREKLWGARDGASPWRITRPCPPRSTGDLLRDHRLGELLELAGVGIEVSDTLAQLLDGHRVFVVHPAEGFLIQADPRAVALLGGGHREPRRHLAGRLLELFKQVRAD